MATWRMKEVVGRLYQNFRTVPELPSNRRIPTCRNSATKTRVLATD
ncbi:MAG: hypothetical protein JWP89_3961 [Schlesneria sp.]|nr:hypothetical protein [Schlesneria sp.]